MNDTTFKPATKRQTWALFCATKKDYRNANLSYDEAARLIDEANQKSGYVRRGNKITAQNDDSIKMGDSINQSIVAEAELAAEIAGNAYLNQYGAHPFNCGFAGVIVKDARTKFAKYLQQKKGASFRSSQGGVYVSMGMMTQDVSAQEAACQAYANVLRRYGIECRVDSRLD